jgi:hypothetical protein
MRTRNIQTTLPYPSSQKSSNKYMRMLSPHADWNRFAGAVRRPCPHRNQGHTAIRQRIDTSIRPSGESCAVVHIRTSTRTAQHSTAQHSTAQNPQSGFGHTRTYVQYLRQIFRDTCLAMDIFGPHVAYGGDAMVRRCWGEYCWYVVLGGWRWSVAASGRTLGVRLLGPLADAVGLNARGVSYEARLTRHACLIWSVRCLHRVVCVCWFGQA